MHNRLREKTANKDFEESVLEHINSLYNLALQLTRNREDANDLVQETTLRAFRFYHKFEQGTNFKAWILTIMRNIFINQYRKRVKQPAHINYEEWEDETGDFGIIEPNGLTEEVFGESVQKSIDKLPEELRSTVILFYVEGLPYKDIAKVMSRLHMARQMLKKQLSILAKKGL